MSALPLRSKARSPKLASGNGKALGDPLRSRALIGLQRAVYTLPTGSVSHRGGGPDKGERPLSTPSVTEHFPTFKMPLKKRYPVSLENKNFNTLSPILF